MHIEIITTPNESLKESGFGSLKACHSVLESIKRMGFAVSLEVCKTKNDLADIVKRKPELVILAVKYIPVFNQDDSFQENIWLSDYFSHHGINFSGSSRKTLKFDSNKVFAKAHLTGKGIKTAKYFLATPRQYQSERDLPVAFPLFLKPMDAANGNGIDDLSFVTNFSDYESKVSFLYKTFSQPTLVEEYLGGREFTVAIIKSSTGGFIVSAVEVVPAESKHGLRVLGAQAKKDDSEELKKIVGKGVEDKVTALAVDVFDALGVRDYGRIDIKTDDYGECLFMEANLVPGMTRGSSYFPKACEIVHELPYDKVVELLIAGGLERAFSTFHSNCSLDSNEKSEAPV